MICGNCGGTHYGSGRECPLKPMPEVASLQSKLRAVILPPKVARTYEEMFRTFETKITPFCAICKRENSTGKLMCWRCRVEAFNNRGGTNIYRDFRRYEGYKTTELEDWVWEVSFVLYYLRLSIRAAKKGIDL